ncbi:MAG: TlpA disulfide reductase family protein [Bacteroidota bacterium]
MSRSILFFLCLVIHAVCTAQNVVIQGAAKGYENKEIGLWIANDYISNAEKQLTFSTIDSAGNFILELKSNEIEYITLKIGKNIASMFIEPHAVYDVMLYPPDSTTYHNQNLEHDIKISIKLNSKTEINALTIDYDKRFDNFLSVEYKAFVGRRAQPKIDSFKVAMNAYYSTVHSNYFNGYITYTIAALEEKTNLSQKKLFENYIDKKPILYNHAEYFNFFNTFYKERLQSYSLTVQGSDLKFQINDRGSYRGAMGVLIKSDFLNNDTLCELVLLKGLYESYHDGTFKKSSIIYILEQIITESQINEHKRIAQNVLNSFSKLRAGSTAPMFVLPDKAGHTHSLDELRSKKYVYLMFFESGCTSCLQQMKVIPSLKKEYGNSVEFVSVSTDKSNVDLVNFCLKNPKFDWVFLYDNSGAQLRKEYEIRSFPAYFLINREGKFIQAPAESPDGDIDRILYDITKPKGKRHNVGDKGNK